MSKVSRFPGSKSMRVMCLSVYMYVQSMTFMYYAKHVHINSKYLSSFCTQFQHHIQRTYWTGNSIHVDVPSFTYILLKVFYTSSVIIILITTGKELTEFVSVYWIPGSNPAAISQNFSLPRYFLQLLGNLQCCL